MGSLLNRFKAEQLNADLDLSLSRVAEGDGALTVRAKLGGVRLVVCLIFIAPGILLLWHAQTTRIPAVLVTAALCCPVLFVTGMLLGFLRAEKSFDLAGMKATKTINWFGLRLTETEPLPKQGVIQLSSQWDISGEGAGCWWHNVSVPSCRGCNFTIARDYDKARSFAEQLARFLHYGLEDFSEPHSREF